MIRKSSDKTNHAWNY